MSLDLVDVVIVGAGIGGLTLGAIFRKLEIPFRILERTATVTPQGAGISLAPNCLRALEQLGLYEKIAANSQKLYGIDIHHEYDYWGRLDFGLAKSWFGYHVHSIERHEFHGYLYDAADGKNTVSLGWNVEDIIDEPSSPHVLVKGSNGQQIAAKVVVGADGIRSVTRRILARNAGILGSNTIRFTGRVHMSGYTAPLKNLGEAELGIGNWLLYDKSILTTWPCKDNRQWFIGVKAAKLEPGETPDRSVWKGATREMINEQYGDKFHPFGENCRVDSIVNRAERVVASNVFEEKDFPRMVKGRVALLGDAAHSMTSFFGQGACQAIEDAVELGNALATFSTKAQEDGVNIDPACLPEALSRYDRARQARARDLVAFSSAYAKLHTGNLPCGTGRVVRAFVYKWVPSSVWMWYLRWLWGYQPVVESLALQCPESAG